MASRKLAKFYQCLKELLPEWRSWHSSSKQCIHILPGPSYVPDFANGSVEHSIKLVVIERPDCYNACIVPMTIKGESWVSRDWSIYAKFGSDQIMNFAEKALVLPNILTPEELAKRTFDFFSDAYVEIRSTFVEIGLLEVVNPKEITYQMIEEYICHLMSSKLDGKRPSWLSEPYRHQQSKLISFNTTITGVKVPKFWVDCSNRTKPSWEIRIGCILSFDILHGMRSHPECIVHCCSTVVNKGEYAKFPFGQKSGKVHHLRWMPNHRAMDDFVLKMIKEEIRYRFNYVSRKNRHVTFDIERIPLL